MTACVVCSTAFVASRAWSRYCGETCRKSSHRDRGITWKAAHPQPRKHPDARPCAQCATPFVGRSRFCRDECATKYHRDADRDRRRAVSKGRRAERIFRRVVFSRDDWTCRLCGEAVDRLAQHPSPSAPSLDHIIPLSLGGPHVYANVQLAHLGCNIRKGAHVAA